MKPQLSLKGRALRYLSMREHSRIELQRKLSPHAADAEELDMVLNWLAAADFMSDQRFSDSLVNRRSARYGNYRILAELQTHALEGEDLARIREQLSEGEGARAISVLHRKFPAAPLDQNERMRHSRFLQQRGFSGKAVQLAMRAPRDEDDQ